MAPISLCDIPTSLCLLLLWFLSTFLLFATTTYTRKFCIFSGQVLNQTSLQGPLFRLLENGMKNPDLWSSSDGFGSQGRKKMNFWTISKPIKKEENIHIFKFVFLDKIEEVGARWWPGNLGCFRYLAPKHLKTIPIFVGNSGKISKVSLFVIHRIIS